MVKSMDRIEQLRDDMQELLRTQDERGVSILDDIEYQLKEEELMRVHDAMERQAVAQAVRNKPKGTQKKSTWYVCRLSIRIPIEEFQKIMQKIGTSSYIDRSHGLTYVLEQGGEGRESRGSNPHVHARFRSILTDGRLKAKLLRATGLSAAGMKLEHVQNINATVQYMLGHKGNPAKAETTDQRLLLEAKARKVGQDTCWRIEEGFKKEYTINV